MSSKQGYKAKYELASRDLDIARNAIIELQHKLIASLERERQIANLTLATLTKNGVQK